MKLQIGQIFLVLLICFCQCSQPDRFEYIQSFQSDYVKNRNITVYLPPSYYTRQEGFPVLYMHDGQMLFDSTTTWNGQEWGVDETMDRLINESKIREAIVVGIWNGDALRHSEYFPQKPFESLPQKTQDSLLLIGRLPDQKLFAAPVQSDSYLKFLISELKPHIDETYKTLPGQEHTFIAGSSMGGLISIYALCEYPEVFGGALCLSTHWPGTFQIENNPIPKAFYAYLESELPDPETHKIYFDYGTETLDSLYEPLQREVDHILIDAGFQSSTFMSKKFVGHEHSERDWNRRLHIPLSFILAREEP